MIVAPYHLPPVNVYAVVWSGALADVLALAQLLFNTSRTLIVPGFAFTGGVLTIITLQGQVTANPGDYIIQNADGSIKTMAATLFTATYMAGNGT